MARTELALQATSRTGLKATYSAATADGFAINNASHNVILHVKNGNAGVCTVTIDTPGTLDGVAKADKTVAIPAGEDWFIGPFPELYDQDSATPDIDVAVYVNFSVQASVTVAAIKMGSLGY